MEWVGEFKGEFLSDGRSVRLIEGLGFVDSKGGHWQALPNSIVDGASIPRFFWRFIGGPFSGKYRRASVIHDVYCVSQACDSSEVHRVFWEMMRHDNVGRSKAFLMWLAVRFFGPQFKASST